KLSFQMAGHPGGQEKVLGVEIGGAQNTFQFDTTGNDFANMGWQERSWEFTATDEKTTLEFFSLSPEDPYRGPDLDDVKGVQRDAGGRPSSTAPAGQPRP